jgi:hypothetical protein
MNGKSVITAENNMGGLKLLKRVFCDRSVSEVTLRDKRMEIAETNYRSVGPNVIGRMSDYRKKKAFVHFERKKV